MESSSIRDLLKIRFLSEELCLLLPGPYTKEVISKGRIRRTWQLREFFLFILDDRSFTIQEAIFSLRTSRLKLCANVSRVPRVTKRGANNFYFLLKFLVIGLFVRTLVGQKTHAHRNENLTPFYRGHEFRGPRNRLDNNRQEEFVAESKQRVTENWDNKRTEWPVLLV